MNHVKLKRLQELLQDRSGLHFSTENKVDLEKGVQSAMALAGIDNPDQYYLALRDSSTQNTIWKQLINQLTIGETYFFRDSWQIRALREGVLPALIQERRENGMRILRLWSAGCSTGEEAYSLAILLKELISDIERWHIIILATDINDESLTSARQGIFGSWSFRMETPKELLDKYFSPYGNRYQISLDVRNMVHFKYLNLVEDSFPSPATDTGNMDVILCRNVTIYFDKPTTQQVAGRFHDSLVEGGWLVVGHSEPLASIYSDFETHSFTNATFYRKPVSTPPNLSTDTLSRPGTQPLRHQVVSNRGKKHNGSHPLQTTADRLEQVYVLMEQGKVEEARHILSALLESTPQHIDGLFLLAKLSADEGALENVHEILDNIDRINPLVPQSHYLRALLYQQGAAWDDAKVALRRALYADRNFALAHYYMGELLYTEGNLEQAYRSWLNAADLLTGNEPDSLVPYGDGTTTGTLLHAIKQRLVNLSIPDDPDSFQENAGDFEKGDEYT